MSVLKLVHSATNQSAWHRNLSGRHSLAAHGDETMNKCQQNSGRNKTAHGPDLCNRGHEPVVFSSRGVSDYLPPLIPGPPLRAPPRPPVPGSLTV
jgi:hypothetical protein